MRIGITGHKGLIGWHMRCFLRMKEAEFAGADVEEFESDGKLHEFVTSADAIVHLAGMNRGDDSEVAETNVAITRRLIDACKTAGAAPHVVFSSSTHISRGTAYGESKKKCSRLLAEWAEQSGALFTNLVLPNVFGEGGRPFYNSVVSTFCRQVADGEAPRIIEDNETEQIHAQEVARVAYESIRDGAGGDRRVQGIPILVSDLLKRIKEFDAVYRTHEIPALSGPFDVDLFNTFRSYLFPAKYPAPLELRADERGALFEAAKCAGGGQTFVSTTKPGVTRGNHYHSRKIERFLVVRGDAEICVRKLFSESVHRFAVSGDKPQYIDMPAFHTHNITNTGQGELMTLFWSNEVFDPNRPDTFPETV